MTSNVLFSTITSSTGSVAISASLAGFALGTLFGSSKEPLSRLFVQNQAALTANTTSKIPNRPLTRTEVEELFQPGSWQRDAYDDYTKVLLDDDLIFPCIYATKGYKADDQVYTFIDSDDLSDQRHIKQLAHMLSLYLPTSRNYGPNTSLVLLAKKTNNPRPMDEYNDAYWKMLDGIAKLDPKPWPENVPKDIDTDKWCLCFAGEAMFSVIQTPAHQVRRSRHAPGVTIVFQPKWIFDVLFSSEAKRAASLGKVRALLKKYDPIPVSPELKNYGDEGSREAQQYFLLDENIPAACPFSKLSPSSAAR